MAKSKSKSTYSLVVVCDQATASGTTKQEVSCKAPSAVELTFQNHIRRHFQCVGLNIAFVACLTNTSLTQADPASITWLSYKYHETK